MMRKIMGDGDFAMATWNLLIIVQVVLFSLDVVVVLGDPVEPGVQQVYFDSGYD